MAPPTDTITVLGKNVEALKTISKNKYDASALERLLNVYKNSKYRTTKYWGTEQWLNAVPAWDIIADALIRGAEIAGIVCGTLGLPWEQSWENTHVVPRYLRKHRNDTNPPSELISDFYARGGQEKLAALYSGIPYEDIVTG